MKGVFFYTYTNIWGFVVSGSLCDCNQFDCNRAVTNINARTFESHLLGKSADL